MAEAELTKIIGNSYVIIKSSGSRTQKPTEGQVKKEDYHSVEISEPCSGESPNSHGTEADKIHTESTSIFHSKGVRRTGKKVVRNWGDIQVINQNSNKEENHSIEVKGDKWSTSTESYVVYHSNARRKKIVNNNHNIINEVPFHDISTATKMNEQRLSTNKNPGIVIKSATDSSKVYHRRPIGWVEPITKDQNVIVVETPKERVIENNGRIVKIGESYIQYHSSGKRQPKYLIFQ
ncbi:hypothetical protein TRFO_33800 [Tritrichomonas foetus]|uniref:Uncharacterized protein n=1 Tax=Tritrichomonas foetus TaxID=1144522 RepID=A0A1J4JQC8_9EUKA|nr:hypothetical protein TRFO_33800 [Tritrichomonas foetus]|eukprot:OHS99723.1 hypothetical protein TRFO_33800 [Tritrichomonas foetus]